jgi:SAM-dependent methyltransferase
MFTEIIEKVKRYRDSLKGLDFNLIAESDELGLDPKLFFRSSPSGDIKLYFAYRDLNIKTTDKILDIGCGKGSAMRTLHKFEFQVIDGIEIAESICEIARNNFALLSSNRCDIFCLDARDFNLYDRYNHFYLYNPFPDEVINIIIDKIVESRGNQNLPTTITYNNPTCHALFVAKNIPLIRVLPGRGGNKINIYKIL